MKKLFIIVNFLLSYILSYGQCSNFGSQFPGTTQSTTSTTYVNIATCYYGSDYSKCAVTNGTTYWWTTNGDTDWDTQITLWNEAHTISYAYNDDITAGSNVQSTVSWTATFTGNVDVLLSKYNCVYYDVYCMTMQWKCSAPTGYPVITSTSASNISYTTTTTGGNVTSDGGYSISERGVCYSTSSNPTTSNSKVTSSGTTGSYSCDLSSLSSATLYYFRAYAINSQGISYGDNLNFTTLTYTAPTSPTLYNTATGEQVAFNNAKMYKSTPKFAVSATGDATEFYVELNTTSTFSGTSYTQTFTGTYISGTKYVLFCNNLSTTLPNTYNTPYWVRIKAKNGTSSYSAWSTSTSGCDLWTFIYGISELGWHLTTTEQFGKATKQLQSLDDYLSYSSNKIVVNQGSFSGTASSSGVYEGSWYSDADAGYMTIGYQSGCTCAGCNIYNGIRFTSVKIPKSADILSTSLNLYGSTSCPCFDPNTSSYNVSLTADDVDNSPVLSSSITSTVTYPRTTATVNFTSPTTDNKTVTGVDGVLKK